jgi:hypothetical protein
MQGFFVFAQQNPSIVGKVVDSKTQKPLQSVVATIQNTNITVLTNAQGIFVLERLAVGNQLLKISSVGYLQQMLAVEVVEGKKLDLGVVILEEDQKIEQQLSLITITENDLGDSNSGSENTAGLLQASRDAFQQTAAFNWGQSRFRIRGLDNMYGAVMINGVTMNKIADGRPQWGNWGGLNDATRNQEFTPGSAPSDYTFGGILGTQEINTRASSYRPGNRVSFAGTNTNYKWRMMGTVASGMSKDGWAYVVSAGRRWAEEGYFEGTNYAANSFFASVEKKINDQQSLNFTTIYAQNRRGTNSANTAEITRIAGVKYNSQWGYQDGEKRSARIRAIEEPIFMLTHYWQITPKSKLTSNVAYQFGTIGNSRIDFQNATNPDPVYYRNLPSYFTSLYNTDPADAPASAFLPGGLGGVFTPDLLQANNANFFNNRQIDWNAMYKANSTPIINSDNIEIGRAAAQSKYVLYEDRTDDKLWTANSIFNSQINDNIVLNAGVTFRKLKSANFQNVLDLLGGAYYLDIDNFQKGSAQQADLNNVNRQVKVGDKYAYNYNLFANNMDAFTQFKFTYKKVDFYLAQSYARAEYQREGLFRNGIYANSSFGRSKQEVFDNFGFKGGLTYKMTGRMFLDFNSVYMTKAPSLRSAFPNARLNNATLDGLSNERISSIDASYIIKAPSFKARLSGYGSRIQNVTETSFFFAEGAFEDNLGDGGNAFVAEIVTGLDKLNIGAELGLEYQITSTIKVTGAASYGQYTYSNNPNLKLNNDNNAAIGRPTIVDLGSANMKNYKQPGMPQQAYSVGLEYRDPKFWWVGANVNYLADNYLDIATLLRTKNFLRDPDGFGGSYFPEATEARTRELLKQEKFAPVKLLNLTGGKSWRISGKTIGFFASVNNVLDFTYKTGGFENVRNANYRQLNQDASSGTPSFGARYFYGFGRTYFLNLYLNF